MALMSRTVRLVLITAVLVLGVIAALFIYVHSIISGFGVNVPPTGRISAQVSIENMSVYVDDSAKLLAYYVLAGYHFTNVTSANISISAYQGTPAPRIYLVNTQVGLVNYCLNCFSGSQLYSALHADLQRDGFIINDTSMNYVSIDNLSEVPNDSVVILATGLMPVGLLPDSLTTGPHPGTGNFTILNMMNRGDTIVYVGRNFTSELGASQTIFVTPQVSLNLLTNSSIYSVPVNYTVRSEVNPKFEYNSSGLTFNSPTFWFYDRVDFQAVYDNFGNVSAVNYGNGTLLAFSNYPNVGWGSANQLAGDIVDTLNSRFWMPRIAFGNQTLDFNANIIQPNSIGIVPLVTTAKAINNTPYASSIVNASHGLVTVKLYNANQSMFYEELLPFTVTYKKTGILSMPSVWGQEQTLPIQMEVNNITKDTSFHIELYDENHSLLASIPVGFYNGSFDILYYQALTLPPGYYVASLRDINDRTYATSLFYMAPVTITPRLIDFANGNFSFVLSTNNQTLSGTPYTVSLNGQYMQNGTINKGQVKYELPSHTVLGYGTKNFVFNIYGQNFTYSVPYQQSTGNGIPSLYIEFAIGVVVVVLLNLILKAPVADDYFVDVPNFPASAKIKIKANSSAITNIFETVNYYYHWRLMPLTVDEVKAGIGSSVRYENVPISITTQNTLNILTMLVNKGELVTSSGYYAPKKWTTASRHDIEYLVIFRKLRDYCVANAVLFTELDSDRNADMTITKKGSQAQVVIYSSTSGMRDVALGSPYKIFIIFIDEQARVDFIKKIYTSYGEKAELLKVGIENQSIVLLDTGDLRQLIF